MAGEGRAGFTAVFYWLIQWKIFFFYICKWISQLIGILLAESKAISEAFTVKLLFREVGCFFIFNECCKTLAAGHHSHSVCVIRV